MNLSKNYFISCIKFELLFGCAMPGMHGTTSMAPCGRYGDAAVNREDDYTSIEIL